MRRGGWRIPERKAARKKISISVDPGVHARANELGLNVSAFCNRALNETIERLEESGKN